MSMEYICNDCPRRCGALRGENGNGACGMGADAVVARAALHFDEEPVISGTKGSGAVFFSGCSLRCVYCQNAQISHRRFGRRVSTEGLKAIYRSLRDRGAHNIDLVNPTHFSRAILASLDEDPGIPVIYNTGGYDSVETLRKFEGKVSVYLPDLKYVSSALSRRYSACPDYFEKASAAIREMIRQTGEVVIGGDGTIRRGTVIRHLVLPGCTADSLHVLEWIAENAKGAWVSLMSQYTPMESRMDQLHRSLSPREYERAVRKLYELGLTEGFLQESGADDGKYIPAFDLTGVPEEEN